MDMEGLMLLILFVTLTVIIGYMLLVEGKVNNEKKQRINQEESIVIADKYHNDISSSLKLLAMHYENVASSCEKN